MRTIDHKLLGTYLIQKMELQGTLSGISKIAFLWGNIEPDINCLTHLKGFLHNRQFHGHNFQNGRSRIKSLLRKIQRGHVAVIRYYRMGKVMHYMADTFTFPHNEFFPGDITQHVNYEHMLHHQFLSVIHSKADAEDSVTKKRNQWIVFNREHRQYVSDRKNALDDIRYILASTSRCLNGMLMCI